jgi:hypothetical protein
VRAGPASPWLLILVAVGAGAGGWMLGRGTARAGEIAGPQARGPETPGPRGTDDVPRRDTARVRRTLLVRVPPGATTLELSARGGAEARVVEPLAFVGFTGPSAASAPTIGVVGPDPAFGAVERWAVITDPKRSPYAWLRLVVEQVQGAPPPILWVPFDRSDLSRDRVVALCISEGRDGAPDEARALEWRGGLRAAGPALGAQIR